MCVRNSSQDLYRGNEFSTALKEALEAMKQTAAAGYAVFKFLILLDTRFITVTVLGPPEALILQVDAGEQSGLQLVQDGDGHYIVQRAGLVVSSICL